MIVDFPIKDVRSIDPTLLANGTVELCLCCDMTERQMFEALQGFLQRVPATTWQAWIERINSEETEA